MNEVNEGMSKSVVSFNEKETLFFKLTGERVTLGLGIPIEWIKGGNVHKKSK